MNRSRRYRLAVFGGFFVFAGILVGIGALLGASLRSPEELAALAEPPPPTPVFAEAERRSLVASAVLRATAAEVEPEGLDFPLGGGSVVTSIASQPGTVIGLGELLVTIEGRPRIALEGEFPFYRSLAPGDRGPDVAQLEANLVSLGFLDEADDLFDRATQRGLHSLYRSTGFEPPGEKWWRATADENELVVFDELPLELGDLNFDVGDDLADIPSPHLLISPRELVLVADVDDPAVIAALKPGVRLSARDEVRGRDLEVRVVEVSPVTDGTRVVFAFVGDTPDANFERSLRIDVPVADTGKPVTAVPVTALFTGPDGSAYVVTPDGDVQVRVGLVVDGWAEVEPVAGRLEPGDRVMVSEDNAR